MKHETAKQGTSISKLKVYSLIASSKLNILLPWEKLVSVPESSCYLAEVQNTPKPDQIEVSKT